MITPPSQSFKPEILHPEFEPKVWIVLCDFTSHSHARKSASTTHKRMVATSAIHCDANPSLLQVLNTARLNGRHCCSWTALLCRRRNSACM